MPELIAVRLFGACLVHELKMVLFPGLKPRDLLHTGDWNLSELEFVRIGICQNSFLLKMGICQNQNLSELEFARIIGICQNWNLSELELVRIGIGQNWTVSAIFFVKEMKNKRKKKRKCLHIFSR